MDTVKAAEETLQKNVYILTREDKQYQRVLPSWDYYIHQWFWDSCTHARGIAFSDPDWAFDEIYSLVAGQWENGMLGHISFNPDETRYFPGPEFWGTHQFSQNGIVTSGITQPPLLAISIRDIFATVPDRQKAHAFIENVLPNVLKYHHYLKTNRELDGSGLLTIIHPWEGGNDNSPRFDQILETINISEIPQEVISLVHDHRKDNKLGSSSDRPSFDDYYRYMYLVHLYKEWQWDYKKIVKESPFAMKDLTFNTMWVRANESLSELLTKLGREDEAKLYMSWADQTRQAIIDCWDDEHKMFAHIDVSQGRHAKIVEPTIDTFIPLYAGAANEKILAALIPQLTDTKRYWTNYPVPTVPIDSEKFDRQKYWRGPTWPITNYFLIEGLNRYATNDACLLLRDELITATIQMIESFGFHEHYDPLDGLSPSYSTEKTGMGFSSFSWSAAVYLILFNKYRK